MSTVLPASFEQEAKKQREKSEKLTLDIAAVMQEAKEDKEEQAQKQAEAIREKNAENFFIRLQGTSEAREAQRQEEQFYVTLSARGVTLEDVQGLNKSYATLDPILSKFSADIIREHENSDKPASATQEIAKTRHFEPVKISRSNVDIADIFSKVDNGDKILDKDEFDQFKIQAEILSVKDTLEISAKHLSEAVSPVEMEKGKAEVSVGQ